MNVTASVAGVVVSLIFGRSCANERNWAVDPRSR